MADAAAPAAPVAAPSAAPSDKTSADPSKAPTKSNTVEAPKAPAEKFLVKVNGKIKEMSREDVIRRAQMVDASRENFEKAAKLTKKNQALLNALQDPDPERQDEALRAMGVDPDKIAERRLSLRSQQAQMTPEQKRIAELEADIKRREQSQADETKRIEQERADFADKQEWGKLETQYLSAIDAASKAGELGGMTPAEALYHMTDEALMNIEYGIQLEPGELIKEAKSKVQGVKEDIRSQAMNLEGDSLLDFFGPDVVNKVCKAAVAKFKAGTPMQQLEKPAPIAESGPQKTKWLRPTDIKTPWL